MRRAMTTISKRLWIEGTVLQLQARLVTSSLVRTFPGPSGYEVKSQGASLEATCKHVEVAKSVSPAGMASPHRNGLQYHRDTYGDNETNSPIPSRSNYVETRDKSE